MSVEISSEAYARLCEWKRELDRLRDERARECEEWDRIYQRREASCYFVIRTLDGLLCYVPMGSRGMETSRLADGRRQLFRQECERKDGLDADPADPLTLTRRIRHYIETDERIRGVPVFEEVRP